MVLLGYYSHLLLANSVARRRISHIDFIRGALRAEHCCTPVAPLRGVPGSVRYYYNKGYIVQYHLRDAPRRTPLPK